MHRKRNIHYFVWSYDKKLSLNLSSEAWTYFCLKDFLILFCRFRLNVASKLCNKIIFLLKIRNTVKTLKKLNSLPFLTCLCTYIYYVIMQKLSNAFLKCNSALTHDIERSIYNIISFLLLPWVQGCLVGCLGCLLQFKLISF